MKKEYLDKINELDIPEPLVFLLTYSSQLKFNEKPDYIFMMKIFLDYIKKTDKYDGKWSFVKDLFTTNNKFSKII